LQCARRCGPSHSRHVVVCSQLPIAVRATRHARAKARGFTLLEILIVLLLLLALAGLVIPAASAWLGNVQGDQVRQQVVELIKDQLIESMRSRQPRVLWVASRPLAGAAPVQALSDPLGETAASDPAESGRNAPPPAPTVRWVLGARLLPGSSDPTGSAGTVIDEGKQPPSLVDLPRGWLLSVATASTLNDEEDASESEGTAAADDGSQTGSGSSATPATQTESTLDSGEPAQAMILWPSGQIDVLIDLELTEPDGRRWKLDVNPWTLSVSWVLSFNPADDAASGKTPASPKSRDAQENAAPAEPVKTAEPSASDATPEPSSANKPSSDKKPATENKDAQERNQPDGTKPSKPDDDQERPDAAMPT
jgi:prepilin-type N-terminal cleavage/methylation domain-containing protein